MKAGIVSSSTLSKHDNWSAYFYLGDSEELDTKIERSEKRLADAQRRLTTLRKRKADGQKFVGSLVESGEVTPIQIKK